MIQVKRLLLVIDGMKREFIQLVLKQETLVAQRVTGVK